jgi:FkbM family methyltransferase
MLLSRWFYYLSSIPTLLTGIKNLHSAMATFLRRHPHKPFMLELRDGSRFYVRTLMDIWILKEAYLDRQYERVSIEIQDRWTILDIGAGIGDFAIGVAKRHPQSTLYAYEPFPESYALLQENLRLNGIENVKAFPLAISGKKDSLQLHLITPEPVQHSTAVEKHPAHNSISVPNTTLDQALTELELPYCDYLKMDCEGAEYDILFNTSPNTLKKIRHICLEHHDGVTPYSHTDLIRFLERHGFQVRHTPNPVHRHLGFVYAEQSG